MFEDDKTVFFALDILAPWPERLPHGRLLAEGDRHMTLAFLGRVPFTAIQEFTDQTPLPPFSMGLAGMFESVLFLPPKRPRVVAWHGTFLEQQETIIEYQRQLADWLNSHEGIHVDMKRDFLPHTTISRGKFNTREWENAFFPIPFIAKGLQLYESLGYSRYNKIWGKDFLLPFEEMDHTADIAFKVRGATLSEIHLHALTALAFEFPEFLGYFEDREEFQNLEDIIIDLNARVSKADEEIGCPFKAVSFHGNILKIDNNLLEWEMIVDV